MLDAALPLVAELGWSRLLVERAAGEAGLSRADASLLVPNGPRDQAALLSRRHDEAAIAALGAPEGGMTGKIRRAVLARVEAAAADEAAVRRCLAFTVLPTNLPLGLGLLWQSADALWRWAGDTATDYNHYSKRAILGAVYGSTMAVFLNDESENFAETRAFLARRIDRVMRFESWKHRRAARSAERPSFARFVGRLRYPGR